MKYVVRVILPLLLCLCLSCVVFAQEQPVSLTLHFAEEKTAFSGAEFCIYRVAQIQPDGSFLPTEAFADYPIDRSDDPEKWRALAQTLSAYAARDQIAPSATAQTDKNGDASFPDLQKGLYLAVGELYQTEGKSVLPTPMLLCLPADAQDGTQIFNLVCNVKFEEKPVEKTSLTVMKVWEKDNERIRPTSVTAQLLENGTVVSEVVLNAKNNWKHTWENLDTGKKWEVTEKVVPADYTVRVEQNGNLFCITNTYGKTPPEDPDLPQTGLLQWPIPVLSGIGLLSLCIGLLRSRPRRYEK